MYIEYLTAHDKWENYKKISIDIADNLPIGELIAKIHEVTQIPPYYELKLKNRGVTKVRCRYSFLNDEEAFEEIPDFAMKISEFPLSSPNGMLRIYIENTSFFVN